MRQHHRITVAALLGCATLAGTVALSKTVQLGADVKKPPPVDANAIASRNAQLTAAQRSAEAALAKKTPPLPPVPKTGRMAVPNLGPLVITRFVAPHASSTASTRTRRARAAAAPAPRPRTTGGSEAAKRRAEAAAEAAKKARERAGEGTDD